MNQKYRYGIGPVGRWLIFAGIPWAVGALAFVCMTNSVMRLERFVTGEVLPYVFYGILYGTGAGLVIGGMVLYKRLPKQLVIPLGIAGWMLTVLLLCWYFWFGPGALKM